MNLTLIGIGAGLALFLFANYMSRRPPSWGRVRFVPYHGLQFVGLLVMILAIAHLVSLITGQPLEGRMIR